MDVAPKICSFLLDLLPYLWMFLLFCITLFLLPALTVVVFVIVANTALTQCVLYRRKARAAGRSFPRWKQWSLTLFLFGITFVVTGFLITWLLGLNVRTVWIGPVGFVLVETVEFFSKRQIKQMSDLSNR